MRLADICLHINYIYWEYDKCEKLSIISELLYQVLAGVHI